MDESYDELSVSSFQINQRKKKSRVSNTLQRFRKFTRFSIHKALNQDHDSCSEFEDYSTVSVTSIDNTSIVSEVIKNKDQFKVLFSSQETVKASDNDDTITDFRIDSSRLVKGYLKALEESQNLTSVSSPRIRLKQKPSLLDYSRKKRNINQVLKFVDINSKDEDNRFGFTDNVHRKAVKKGFNFTIMVIGQSGLGKSTLVNSLFQQELYKDLEVISANQKISKTTKIEKRQIELDERGVKLRLTIVDTPGFGESIDCTDSWKSIEEYIDGTFEQYFKDECGLNRKNIQDNRIHCCLYFVSPYGRGLCPLDIEVMRRLQKKVNILPIIAKADTLTLSELKKFKQRLMDNLTDYQIETYRLPECDSDEDDEIKKLDKEIKAVLPFAVIGSNTLVESESVGKRVRGRQYPWGTVEVDNSGHCDFAKLRLFLLKTHMQDLKDMTLEVHYENYRAEYITDRMSKRQNDRSKLMVNGNVSINNGTNGITNSLYKSSISSEFPNKSDSNNQENGHTDNGALKANGVDQNTQANKVKQMINRYPAENNNYKFDAGKDSPQLPKQQQHHQTVPPPMPVLVNGTSGGMPVAAGN